MTDLVRHLRATIRGRVLAPADAEYDSARVGFVTGLDTRPAAIVQVADATDVAAALSVARDESLPLAVRGGGHSPAGHGMVEGGVVVDLRAMRGLEIDATARTAWADGGLTAGEYTKVAAAHGLATGFGDTGTVGIGGITLAGGVGFLHRAQGLTIDNLLAAEVVTATGDRIHTDEETHPDLFWALRGGGGNFGVVTRFRYRLHEVGTVTSGQLIVPATAARIAAFLAAALESEDAFSGLIVVAPAPPMPMIPAEHHGRMMIMAHFVHSGPLGEGERAFARLRAIAPPVVDHVEAIPYPRIYEAEGGPPNPTFLATRSTFLDHMDDTLAQAILDALAASTAQVRMAQFRVLGGAVARVPVEATAFAHRHRGLLAVAGAMYTDAGEAAPHQAWVTELAAALGQGEPGAYTGFLSSDDAAHTRAAYPGATGRRLAVIKARWDPHNLFRRNVNVVPERERV
ncbi:MAG TPA: FAD-binding oxidoreductase [Longimicrobiales bacterium]|nr:FAD-binding oxidoreductase [Longimicrobiales bacterium]